MNLLRKSVPALISHKSTHTRTTNVFKKVLNSKQHQNYNGLFFGAKSYYVTPVFLGRKKNPNGERIKAKLKKGKNQNEHIVKKYPPKISKNKVEKDTIGVGEDDQLLYNNNGAPIVNMYITQDEGEEIVKETLNEEKIQDLFQNKIIRLGGYGMEKHYLNARLFNNEPSFKKNSAVYPTIDVSSKIDSFSTDKKFEVLALPAPRPPFPHYILELNFTFEEVEELKRIHASDFPYVAFFCEKSKEIKNHLSLLNPEDKMHEVGSLCSMLKVIHPATNAANPNYRVRFYVHKRIKVVDNGTAPAVPVEVAETTTTEGLSENENEIITSESTLSKQYCKVQVQILNPQLTECNPQVNGALSVLLQHCSDLALMHWDTGLFPRQMIQEGQIFSLIESREDVAEGQAPAAAADVFMNFLYGFGPDKPLRELTYEKKEVAQQIFEEMDPFKRIQAVSNLLKEELESGKIMATINSEIDRDFQNSQRRLILKEQQKRISLLLEEKGKVTEETKEENPNIPEEVKLLIEEETTRLKSLDSHSTEYSIIKTHVELLQALPWGKFTEDCFNVYVAKKVLEEDHYGMEKVKDRILEFIAVAKLRQETQGKILCLVGPPGTGKTSIAKSMARALGRKYFRFSVGGLTDSHELKGHRKTYIGAMPGKITNFLKRGGVMNPLILIDEIDKMGGVNQHGNPAATMLELLDPEQNNAYLDHYVDVPMDVSKVLFICTANSTDTVPEALLDRMEVINVSGYILEEKINIAKSYIIPEAKETTGTNDCAGLSDEAIKALCTGWCRENGMRSLKMHIEKIHRKIALKIVKEEENAKSVIEPEHLIEYVGLPNFTSAKMYDETPVGVVVGLAWTSMGGTTLYVESVAVGSEKGAVQYTGRLGKTMSESAQLAFTFSKAFVNKHHPELSQFFDTNTVHVHCPEGAVPKDGPSAGITFVTSILSLAQNKAVKQNIAMTGEVSLTGKVLKIGGVREKVVASRLSDIDTVIVPAENKSDVYELPEYLKEGLKFHYVSNYSEVYDIVFENTDNKKNNLNDDDIQITVDSSSG